MTILFIIILVIAGIVVEKKYSPRITTDQNKFFFHYTESKGIRHKVKLF